MIDEKNYSDLSWLQKNIFTALQDISSLLENDEPKGRDCLIRLLENRLKFQEYEKLIDDLIQKAGLYPYLSSNHLERSIPELLSIELHKPDGMEDITLHSFQGKVYWALMDGHNVVLSAPTSFGKSLLIDTVIASKKYKSIVVIVPTIALIDETRRRLSRRFKCKFKIITHPGQAEAENNIYVLTQERYIELEKELIPDFFIIDEFYKLSPNRGDDERTFVLNHAFYRLLKSSAQFFMIGPNVKDINVDSKALDFMYFSTDFATVSTEIVYPSSGTPMENAVRICSEVVAPTMIFCKSAQSAYKLADKLIEDGVVSECEEMVDFVNWASENYHPDWKICKYLKYGLAIHHGSLPRSIAYHLLRLFNLRKINFLLCTSTIIEGVNTSAKNVIIYDKKIANLKPFDLFTFNNIKGRAGRMNEHFVGRVYVLDYEPQEDLPLVEIPSITQSKDAPDSLLIQIEDCDLSEDAKERLRYLHAQDDLSIDTIKNNSGIHPESQIELAQKILSNMSRFHTLLAWDRYPTNEQLMNVCNLMFEFLVEKGKDTVFSDKQLHFKISRLLRLQTFKAIVEEEIKNGTDVTQAIEETLLFFRRWCEHHFPKYLAAFDKIQREIFEKHGYVPGDYSFFGKKVKQLLMPISATILDEYGIPSQISLKLEEKYGLGDDIDSVIQAVKEIKLEDVELSAFEAGILHYALEEI